MILPACRLCGDKLTRVFIDLGEVPLAHRVIAVAAADAGEDRRYKLKVRSCDRCLLVQLDATPEDSGCDGVDLPYYHEPAPARVVRNASSMIDRFGLGPESMVMEVASTDGSRLLPFKVAGIPVLGIEPLAVLGDLARASGIPTETALLNAETAMEIAARHGRADFVVAHGVLAEVSDLFGFAAGFAGILRPNGIAAFDFPHLLWLMEQMRFDCIDHAHRSYLSLLVVERIMQSVGLLVFDLERLPPPGGSLRVFVGHARGPYLPRPSVKSMRLREMAAGLDQPAGYGAFTPKVQEAMRAVRAFVDTRKRAGRRIVAYGITPEANTLLNCCGITHNDILCLADPDPARHGMWLPGSHIPVVSSESLMRFRPDDVMVFPCDGPLDTVMELAARMPIGTRFWSMAPNPRVLPLRSEAA